MSEINWNAELRKVERQFDGLPPEPTPEERREQRAAEQLAQERRDQDAAAVGAWARLLLVAALAGAIQVWPYPRECGPGLFVYVGAGAVIAAGGLWVAVYTWRGRMGKTHVLALTLALWGTALVAVEVLPRVGYARVDPTNPPQWWCAEARK
jgi:hypothetical protein